MATPSKEGQLVMAINALENDPKLSVRKAASLIVGVRTDHPQGWSAKASGTRQVHKRAMIYLQFCTQMISWQCNHCILS
jgi:hypothetical protein